MKANIFAIVLLIPLILIGGGAFYLKNGVPVITINGILKLSLFMIAFIAMVIFHELVHGMSWSVYAKNGWKDIRFGFMKQYLTPYCTCLSPLSRGQYILGALNPLIYLGIFPMVVGILTGSANILFIGILMADAAAGDIMIVWKLLRYKSDAFDVIYMDHPTQAGGVIFEK